MDSDDAFLLSVDLLLNSLSDGCCNERERSFFCHAWKAHDEVWLCGWIPERLLERCVTCALILSTCLVSPVVDAPAASKI